MSAPYGLQILTQLEARHGRCRDLIGAVDRAPAGNLVLRIGQENAPGEHGWSQIAHVVLSPDETRDFMFDVAKTLGWHLQIEIPGGAS